MTIMRVYLMSVMRSVALQPPFCTAHGHVPCERLKDTVLVFSSTRKDKVVVKSMPVVRQCEHNLEFLEPSIGWRMEMAKFL